MGKVYAIIDTEEQTFVLHEALASMVAAHISGHKYPKADPRTVNITVQDFDYTNSNNTQICCIHFIFFATGFCAPVL